MSKTKAPTKYDLEKFKQWLSARQRHPLGRIEIMQERLDALEKITPAMQHHIDAIRKIHADFLAKNILTIDAIEALDYAQGLHWNNLVMKRDDVIPYALLGRQLSAKAKQYATYQSIKRKGKTALTQSQQNRVKTQYETRVRNGEKYGALKALSAQFDVSVSTIKNILK